MSGWPVSLEIGAHRVFAKPETQRSLRDTEGPMNLLNRAPLLEAHLNCFLMNDGRVGHDFQTTIRANCCLPYRWWGRTGLHRLASGYQPDALLAVSYAPKKHARMMSEENAPPCCSK